MHFLVEDSRLLNTVASPESARTNPLSYDEVTHQDNLAIPVLISEHMANNNVPAAYFMTVPFRKLASSPILPPPKIA
jgi:hypothetical protein